MAKYLINNAKPNVMYKDSPEYKRIVELPKDEKGFFPIKLPYEQEQKRQMTIGLAKNASYGQSFEIPSDVSAFECGEPKYSPDPKNPSKQIVDTSEIRKYPGIKMGEILKFEVDMDAIETMMRIRFLDECDAEGTVILKNREGAKYEQLLKPEETEELLKKQDIKWKERVKNAEKAGLV